MENSRELYRAIAGATTMRVRAGGFPTVSRLFPACYVASGAYTREVTPRPSSPGDSGVSGPFPGERLGLPREGARSVGRFGRRLGAISIDWIVAYGLSFAFARTDQGTADATVTLVIFAVMQIVLITLLTGSLGHLVVGLRLVVMTGGWVGVLRPVVRTVLLCLVIPAFIWDADQRGLHDRLSGTLLVRR